MWAPADDEHHTLQQGVVAALEVAARQLVVAKAWVAELLAHSLRALCVLTPRQFPVQLQGLGAAVVQELVPGPAWPPAACVWV